MQPSMTTVSDSTEVKTSVSDTLTKSVDIKLQKVYDYDTTKWFEILASEDVILDIRYATENNFMKEQIYSCGRCFIAKHLESSILAAIQQAVKDQWKLVFYDCYRPRPMQQKLWDIKPDARYVTRPWKGSMHNRGVAIDVGLAYVDGTYADMGTEYDFFGKEAYPGNRTLPKVVLENRDYLTSLMSTHGYAGIRTEWWHFSVKKDAPALSDWEWPCE